MDEDKNKEAAEAFMKGLPGAENMLGDEKADPYMSKKQIQEQLQEDIVNLMHPDAARMMGTNPLVGLTQMTLLIAYCLVKRHGIEGLRDYILDSGASVLIKKDKL